MPADQLFNPATYTMSFGDHLDELRKRVLMAVVVPLPLSLITFFFSDMLIRWLLLPLYNVLHAEHLPEQVQALSPPEVLVTKIKLSLILALVLSGPWIIWQIWLFIRPGLYQQEQRFVRFLLPGSAILTITGLALMYYVMLPLMLKVLVLVASSLQLPTEVIPIPPQDDAPAVVSGFTIPSLEETPSSPKPGQVWIKMPERILSVAVQADTDGSPGVEILELPMGSSGMIAQQFRLKEYINFVMLLLLGIAIAFQMPLVIVLLGWLGLASPQWLRARRRYALFICAVLAAVITPADVLSMIMMLIPLYGLYELGILLLVLAPASAVAHGTIFDRLKLNRGRRAYGKDDDATHPVKPVQPDSTVARTDKDEQSGADFDDSAGDQT